MKRFPAPKILIGCGGSGGHIFPAIALARQVQESSPGSDILFVGTDTALDRRIFEKNHFEYRLLSSARMPYRFSLKTIRFFLNLVTDTARSIAILAGYRPDVVIAFGGYVAAPVIIAAYLLRVPRMIHEQNVAPGRANAALFGLSDRIAISFKETSSLLGAHSRKAVFTGNPVRISVSGDRKALDVKKLGLDEGRFTILVIGGSQGAHKLNEKFISAVSRLDAKTRSGTQIIHITGIKDYSWADEAYRKERVSYRVFSFLDDIEEAYSAADLVVTRSGASALFELACLGRPMILVPYPFARSHQEENAGVFSRNGAALAIKEEDLTGNIIAEKISYLMNNRSVLGAMARNAREMSVPDSSRNLARELFGLIRRE